jgi:hypothetical protein
LFRRTSGRYPFVVPVLHERADPMRDGLMLGGKSSDCV